MFRKIREKLNKIPVVLVLCAIMLSGGYLFSQGTGAWTPASAGAADIGSTTLWFQDIYFGHSTSNYAKFLVTPTAARTYTFPDNNMTFGTDNVLDLAAATTLTAAQSGSLVLFDSSTAFAVKLPAPAKGERFDFMVATSASAHSILTNTTTTDFIEGIPLVVVTATTGSGMEGFACNGSSHVRLSLNGTTTGGIAGSKITLEAISSTIWVAYGTLQGSGSIATPCSAS